MLGRRMRAGKLTVHHTDPELPATVAKFQTYLTDCLLFVSQFMFLTNTGYAEESGDNELYKNESYGKTWMYFPDGDGVPRVAVLKGEPPEMRGNIIDELEITFRLYTRENPDDPVLVAVDDELRLEESPFDPSRKSKFVIHGWKSSWENNVIQKIKNGYLEEGDYNVVGVDWSGLAGYTFYPYPMSNTKRVGVYLARLIDFLVKTKNVRLEDVHIIGHSLGAHVAGFTGASIKSGRVARITGLDPALPGFQYWEGPDGRLDDTDAEFVDIIHTCAGALGFTSAIGHADFYPNGGTAFQPGCCCMVEFIQACSHGRAHEYFAESITSKTGFRGVPCESWSDYKKGACNNSISVLMGDKTPPSTRGFFYLRTNSTFPYALG